MSELVLLSAKMAFPKSSKSRNSQSEDLPKGAGNQRSTFWDLDAKTGKALVATEDIAE